MKTEENLNFQFMKIFCFNSTKQKQAFFDERCYPQFVIKNNLIKFLINQQLSVEDFFLFFSP